MRMHVALVGVLLQVLLGLGKSLAFTGVLGSRYFIKFSSRLHSADVLHEVELPPLFYGFVENEWGIRKFAPAGVYTKDTLPEGLAQAAVSLGLDTRATKEDLLLADQVGVRDFITLFDRYCSARDKNKKPEKINHEDEDEDERDKCPVLTEPNLITPEFAKSLIEFLQVSPVMPPKELVVYILNSALSVLVQEKSLVRIGRKGESKKMLETIICGDTHGQFYDAMQIFEMNGMPSEETTFVFNGDLVDRGEYGLELALSLLTLKAAHKDKNIHILRGNHETQNMNRAFGFEAEVLKKYGMNDGIEVLNMMQRCFQALPLAAVVHSKGGDVFVSHGGIGLRTSQMTLDEIENIPRHLVEPFEERSSLLAQAMPESLTSLGLAELLWSDPNNFKIIKNKGQSGGGKGEETGESEGEEEGEAVLTAEEIQLQRWPQNKSRGLPSGFLFGAEATEEFLDKNNLRFMIRSHQMFSSGYRWHFEHKRCLTVFSCPNYCGSCGNLAAFVSLNMCHGSADNDDDDEYFKITQFDAVKVA